MRVQSKQKKQNRYAFPAVFTYEDGKEIAVTFPDLDVATSGKDEIDAVESARDLLGAVLCGLEEDGEEIPAPSALHDVKTEDGECVVLVDVFMPTFRMAGMNRSVNRTVTLPAWLNAVAVEHNVNFSQTLQDALRSQLQV